MKLGDFKSGSKISLLNFGAASPNYRRRRPAFGLRPGSEVSIKSIAPLGCPIMIEVQNLLLSLRKDEASALNWISK